MIERLTNWARKKVLLSSTGLTGLALGAIDILYAWEDRVTFWSFVPIVFVAVGFVTMKLYGLLLSWALPDLYIKLNR